MAVSLSKYKDTLLPIYSCIPTKQDDFRLTRPPPPSTVLFFVCLSLRYLLTTTPAAYYYYSFRTSPVFHFLPPLENVIITDFPFVLHHSSHIYPPSDEPRVFSTTRHYEIVYTVSRTGGTGNTYSRIGFFVNLCQ